MQPARQQFSAHERTRVIDVNAAILSALVAAARALLVASFFASGVVRAALQVGARELTVHEAATTGYLKQVGLQ